MKEELTKAQQLQGHSTHQIYMLAAMFLLGMAVNLMGLPSELGGMEKTISGTFIALHGLIGLGLIVGAIRALVASRALEPKLKKMARAGLGCVILTFITGVATIASDNGWWSYAMSVGFLAAVLIYGNITLLQKK